MAVKLSRLHHNPLDGRRLWFSFSQATCFCIVLNSNTVVNQVFDQLPAEICHQPLVEPLQKSAHHLLDRIPQTEQNHLHIFLQEKDLHLTNALVTRLAKQERFEEVLQLFSRTRSFGITPTKFAICSVLNCCSKLLNLSLGLQIHAQAVRVGHDSNRFICSALVDIYTKCSLIIEAEKVFSNMLEHDQVSWTSMISGYAQNGHGEKSVRLFLEMLRSGVKPNGFTYATVISACTGIASIDLGKQVHGQAIVIGFEEDSFVINSLLDMYAKCGGIEHAMFLFESKAEKDIVVCNSMIVGYAQNMCTEEALKLFVHLHCQGLKPNTSTFSGVLNACGGLSVIHHGKQIHSMIIKTGWNLCVFVSSSLIDMYSKCGCIEEARFVFDQAKERNRVSWTTMITAYAQNGREKDAIHLFEKLLNSGVKPDTICFTALLTACNHGGFLDKAVDYFKSMQIDHGLTPEIDHYACVVDLYGRNGRLVEAKQLMDRMPMRPNSVLWTSLLGACKIHGDAELAREIAQNLFMIEPHSSAPYVTVANTYADAGRWGEAADVRRSMRENSLKKKTGCSWIEIDGKVNLFTSADVLHPQSQQVYSTLDNLILEMKGRPPSTYFTFFVTPAQYTPCSFTTK